MLQSFISYFQFGNRFCGVEHASVNGNETIYVTILKKVKKELVVDDSFSEKSIKQALEKLPKSQHIFLVVNNDQVLTKVVDSREGEDLSLVNTAFPNINISDFYYEIIKQNTKSFISICRKSYVDNLVSEYLKNGYYIINFSLGNSILSTTINYIEATTITTSNALIVKTSHEIESIDFVDIVENNRYDINGLETSNHHVLSLSSALTSVLGNYNTIVNYEDEKEDLKNTFKQSRFFSQFLKIGLIFILGALLINFFFFNYYYGEVELLNQTSQQNQTTKTKIIKLKEDVSKVEKMTNDMLKSSTSKSSFYMDAIVNSLPESILLAQINYQPLEKSIKPKKAIVLENSVIIVSGVSNDSELYSNWIINLENKAWIDKVEVEKYSDSYRGKSEFSIKIHIGDDK